MSKFLQAVEPVVAPPVAPEEIGNLPIIARAPAGESMLPLIVATLALFTALSIGFYLYRYMPAAQSTEIFVLDMPAVVEMRMEELASESPDQLRKATNEFSKRLDVEIERLTKNGAILLSPDAIVAGRGAVDITEQVVKSVGIATSYDEFVKKKEVVRARYSEQFVDPQRPSTSVPSPIKPLAENSNDTNVTPNLD